MVDDAGTLCIRKESLGIHRRQCLDDDTEVITIQNYTNASAEFALRLHYEADFADMCVVRGMHPRQARQSPSARLAGSTLTLRYDGADKHERTTRLHFRSPPDARDAGDLVYRLSLQPQHQWHLKVEAAPGGRELAAHRGQVDDAT